MCDFNEDDSWFYSSIFHTWKNNSEIWLVTSILLRSWYPLYDCVINAFKIMIGKVSLEKEQIKSLKRVSFHGVSIPTSFVIIFIFTFHIFSFSILIIKKCISFMPCVHVIYDGAMKGKPCEKEVFISFVRFIHSWVELLNCANG